jgi:hypothetical protein
MPDDFEIPPPPSGGGDGGGSSGGGSSSGGSSSSGSTSSAPSEPEDPYTKWYSDLAGVDKKRISTYDQIYNEMWGEPAPFAVLQAAVAQGLNAEEFRIAQMKNEAWWGTSYSKKFAEPLDNYLVALGLDPVYSRKHKGNGDGKKKRGIDRGQADVPPEAMPRG